MSRAVGVVLLLSAACGGCAAPVDGLWPPGEGEACVPIRVLSNGWHSLLFVPDETDPPRGWREWSYGEWDWYRSGETTSGAALSAVLWPTRATVHVVEIESLAFIESAPAAGFSIWRFDVTTEGHERLLAWVRASRAAGEPAAGTARSAWYEAADAYHLFHHCNHWTAAALREAGLPVWSAYALCHTGLEWQLDRAEEWEGEEGEGGEGGEEGEGGASGGLSTPSRGGSARMADPGRRRRRPREVELAGGGRR